VYAFIEEKERSKEEKTRGKSWEIAQISCFVSMLVFVARASSPTEYNNPKKSYPSRALASICDANGHVRI
jgi:hypothetical protein